MKTTKHPLIIGSTGKTGSRVMQRLKTLGYMPKGAARTGEVHFDWEAPTTWAPALNGIDSVYITYYPDLAMPRAPEDISCFCALAKMKGVRHITLLSGRGEPAAQRCEDIVRQSGIDWTIVRAAWFNQNFSEGLFRQFITQGNIALPVNSVTEPFVDIDDLADVVVASLTEPGHEGQLYEITGPELLSFPQLAVRFSALLKRQVTFEQVSLEEFQHRLEQQNVAPEFIAALTYLFTEVLDGRSEFLTDGVQRALGREPKSFNQYILDNARYFEGSA
ncbi:NAD(P)H-binding protein [Lacimicrobium sp. SS2-24]|uniref:NmrA family NAD(P)-binding protein n=1 Tax=Lacimicrobium sp. SS2-24 TaxID=2005569 RepID=UPI000B4BDFE9|nr:NAD(P)H-binding protein [Lacimicrobium sp. SS2-24]